jgi:zinc protease
MSETRRRGLLLPHGGAAVLAVLFLVAPGASAQVRNWPSASPPRPLAARDVRFPPYQLETLANGMKVVVVTHNEQPAVSLRMIVKAGTAQDPAGKPGLAAMLASLLDQGTTTRQAQEVADTIDSVGGRVETGVGRDLIFTDVVVMKDSLGLAMGLLADLIRNPAFAPEEIERQRHQILAGLAVSGQDPEYVANVAFDRLVYGFNPYGYPGNGTPDSVASITRDDLAAYHRRYFAPNNSLLAIVGDLTTEEALAAVDRGFGDWDRREIPSESAPAPPSPTRRVIVIDKPDAVQTEVRVGQPGIPRKHADYTALDLAVRILGGEGANRLHRILRTERGLTYGASAELETLKRSGQIVVKTNTRSAATGEVLRLIADEFSRLRRERVGERELGEAKAYLTGNFPLTLETPDDIATHILNHLFYDLPLGELETYRQRVNAVTVGDVTRVTWDYLRPDQLSVVLVGDAGAFADGLRGVGFGRYERIPLADLDLLAADFRKQAPKTAAGRQR